MSELAAAGHQALGVACDVSDETQVAALVARTVDAFGRLDMAFNNAGIMIAKGELDIAEAEANQPIGRRGRGDEIAAVLWPGSPGASFVLGVALPVDGGYTAH